MMPGLDGAATFKRMRERHLIDDTPVIFLTAKVLPAEIKHFIELGALGVIAKPFDPLTLGNEVMRLWQAPDAECALANPSRERALVDAQVDTLANAFLRRTRDDVARLKQLFNLVVNGEWTTLKESERISHSIHGAGAMFGYPQLSKLAGAMERLIGELLRTPQAARPVNSAALAGVLEHLEELARALHATSRLTPADDCMFHPRMPGR
jgi:CheY-like chemotaxis protein